MNKRFDNKILVYLVVGLIAILAITVLFKVPKTNATLKSTIIEFDTSEVSKIIIYPRTGNGSLIEFNRNNGKWKVQQGTISSAPREGSVQNIFREVLKLKPQNLAAIDKAKWKDFELTDSLATRIQFLTNNGENIGDLMVGKFNYKQVNNPYGGSGANNIQGTSYVRLYNDKEVFGVEGFISFFFNGNFDDWRDKSFIRSNQSDITNISFAYPVDSSYKLIKKEKIWYAGNFIADSLSMTDFLNTLRYLDGQDCRDDFKPVLNPSYQLIVEGNNLTNFTVKCYKQDNSDDYILNSSLNPDVYFTSKRDGIFEKLFKPQNYFLKKRPQ